MRIRNFVLSLMAAAAMFTACENEEAPLGAPSLSFEQESLTVGKEGGTATLSFTATRDWTVSCDESWVSFKSIEGKASVEPQQLTVTADPNDSYDREAEITFVVGKKLVTKTIILYQTGSGQAPLSGEFYSVDFKKDGISGWEVIDVVKPDDLEAVWTESTSYGMVAKAYANNTNYESQSWLVSPSIDLSQVQAAHLCFSHAGKYFSDIKKDVTLWLLQEEAKAAEDVEAFTTQLSIPVYPVDFTFVESGDIDLSSYAGSSIRLAFKYKSSTSKAGTYEVQNLRISTEAYDSGEGGGDEGGEGGEEGGEDADAIYFNNFDKEEATKTYGSSNNSYPYLDQFEGWKNEQGSGASGVSYLFNGMSARSNSTSDGTYSKYAGSGMNNLFFGKDAYIQVNGIELGESRSLVISFGAEKFLSSGDSNFNKDEFKVYVSDTGKKWVALEYEIGGTEISGTWNLNTSEAFTMPSSKLYIHISASVASAYRLDDLKVVASTEAGKTIDTSNGVDLGTGSGEEGGETGGEEGGEEGGEDADAIYFNNFDKEEATKTYGSSNNSYPYLDQFEGWKNEQGSGASGVSYLFNGMSARSNSTSDGTYSKYAGSGMNNLFFGKDAYIQVNGIELGESRSLVISFGAEKFLSSGDSNFNKDEFKVYVSDTGKKWVALEYEIGGTEISGTWNLNTSEAFTMPSSKLYIHISASVASAYRLDDLKVVASTEAGKTIDTSNGVDLGTGSGEEGGETGGEEGGEVTLVGAGTLESPYTAADAIALTSKMTANDSMADVYVKGIISSDLVVNLQYGNATFNISDDGRATGEFNIFRALYLGNVKFTSEDQIKIGDEVVLVGTLVNYKGTAPELKDCHIVQLNGDQGSEEGGEEGGNTGGEEGGNTGGDEGGNTGGEEGGNTGGEEGGNTGGEVDAADYTTTVEYSTISSFDDKGVATINGVSDVKVLKLGSSKAIGSFTLTVPAGTRSVSYYAVGWNGKTTTLKFLQGETEIDTQALVANDGASNSSPFTLTVTDADKYSLDFDAALEADTKITVTTTAIARALLFGIQAVK